MHRAIHAGVVLLRLRPAEGASQVQSGTWTEVTEVISALTAVTIWSDDGLATAVPSSSSSTSFSSSSPELESSPSSESTVAFVVTAYATNTRTHGCVHQQCKTERQPHKEPPQFKQMNSTQCCRARRWRHAVHAHTRTHTCTHAHTLHIRSEQTLPAAGTHPVREASRVCSAVHTQRCQVWQATSSWHAWTRNWPCQRAGARRSQTAHRHPSQRSPASQGASRRVT